MDFVLDLLQGMGLAAAIGIRPLLPVLLAGGLAIGDVGLDFEGTDFVFLEEAPFLIGVAVVIVALELLAARGGPEAAPATPLVYAFGAIAVALGVLEASGSLADRDHSIVAGVVLGGAAAVLGFLTTRSLFTRVRRRLDAEAARALPVYAEGAALIGAGLSILFPPLALLVLAGLAWLLVGARRREGEKYAGLRVLR